MSKIGVKMTQIHATISQYPAKTTPHTDQTVTWKDQATIPYIRTRMRPAATMSRNA